MDFSDFFTKFSQCAIVEDKKKILIDYLQQHMISEELKNIARRENELQVKYDDQLAGSSGASAASAASAAAREMTCDLFKFT